MFRLRITWTLVLLALCIASVHAQSTPGDNKSGVGAKIPAFDVASIHQRKDLSGSMMMRWTPDGSYRGVNITLTSLFASAYDIKMDLISGAPSWVENTHFDVEAKVAPEDAEAVKKLTQDQRRAMLRSLLEDRFHLKAHVETKTLPVYELVVAKGGSKLTPAAPDPPPSPDAKPDDPPKNRGRMMMSSNTFEGTDIPINSFVANLAYIVSRTVIDKTGLTGKYDMKLKWTPEDQVMSAGSSSGANTDSGPSIFTALEEQLGLRLVSSKGPVDTLVIDHVEMPTEN
jgi:uncharacterized protein (TIGR03435 family)